MEIIEANTSLREAAKIDKIKVKKLKVKTEGFYKLKVGSAVFSFKNERKTE